MIESPAIVRALLAHSARITGSWARGEQTLYSDYDFYVPERNWRAFVKTAPPGWESCIIGHVAWRTTDGLIEASSLFRNQRAKRASKTITLFGVDWRTW